MTLRSTGIVLLAIVLGSIGASQPPILERPSAPVPDRPPPRLEPIADTKLIMEGLCKPNFDSLARRLNDKPADAEAWSIIRGQSLIIAETGNLLMLRSPKGRPAQSDWLFFASELRILAASLGKSVEKQDFPASRTAFAKLSNACNRCHEKFDIKTRVTPLPEQ